MKIRTGFVSNSSSSSFCIIGSTIDPIDITDKDMKNLNIFCKTGLWAEEGMLAGYIRERKELEELKTHYKNFTFYKILKDMGEDTGTIYTKDLTEEKYDIVFGEIDHHFELEWVVKQANDEYGEDNI